MAPEPTPAQVEAGNYKKGHIRWNGLPLSIETAAGGVRRGTGPDGKPWEVTMPVPYGYFKGSTGTDGDQVDAFIGPNPAAPQVFVLDQQDPATGKHDEVKALIGFDTAEEALRAYHGSFSDGSGPQRIKAISGVSVDDFKRWLRSPHSDKAFHDLPEHPGMVQQSLQTGQRGEFQPKDTRPPITAVDLSDISRLAPAQNPSISNEHGNAVDESGQSAGPRPNGGAETTPLRPGDGVSERPAAARPGAAVPGNAAQDHVAGGEQGAQGPRSLKEKRKIGVNADGNPIFEDARGVRSFTRDGVRVSENVRLIPKAGGGHDVSVKRPAEPEFEPVESAPKQEHIQPHEQPSAGIRETSPAVPRNEQPGDAAKPQGGRQLELVSAGDRPAGGGSLRDGERPNVEQPNPADGLPGKGGSAGSDTADSGRADDERDRPSAPAAGPAERVDDQADKERRARRKLNYRITAEDRIGQGGPKEKVEANLSAIRALKKIEQEHRDATPVEKKVLVRYVGWGAFAQDVFAQHKGEWAKQRTELKDLLTSEEYAAARASTLNAHYTSEPVIRGMWSAVEQLGYKSGRALEPSAGVGHFIGLAPNKIASATDWSAVELDPVSGNIAKLLYAGADVNVQGFEAFARPDGFYDLAVSNVPFGDYHLRDPKRPSMLIHDYFFAKALDLVRPGGVVAFISSKGTMDKANDSVRRALDKKADFLGAIRLPGGNKGAFAGNAGTEVTTDIIFLRRKAPGAPAPKGKREWLGLKQITTPDGPTSINEYFADHPEMMLGEMRLQGTMYRSNEPVLVGDTTDIEARIAAAAKKLPKGAWLPRGNPMGKRVKDEATVSGDGIKEGAFFEKGGKLYRKVMGVGTPANLNQNDSSRVTSLMHIRDTVNALLAAQAASREGSNVDRSALRTKLGKQYDVFVKKHGAINLEDTTVTARLNKAGENVIITKRPNFAKFSADPDAFKVAAIEVYDPEAKTAKKAAIFSDDILAASVEPSIASAGDTIGVSLNMFGHLDIPEMAKMLGKSNAELIKELGDQIYLNPGSDAWEPAAQYLSGDVLSKLEDAEGAAKSDKAYARNVEALKKVQPTPLTRDEVRVTFGSPWVPGKVFEQFVHDTVDSDISLSLNPLTKRWLVKNASMTQTAAAKYGTSRVDAKSIIEAALNMTTLRVNDKTPTGDVVNEEATREAQIKIAAVRDDFAGSIDGAIEGWVWKDNARASTLEALYNRTYNRLVPQKFDGAHLTLPGLASTITNGAGQVVPFALQKHQKNGVARVLQNGNTLLAHVVGAGKTFTMIASGMEQRRLGQVQRPMYVVPNHMLEQFSREFLQAYPGANILVAQKDEMTRENRKAFGAKVASQKWDGVVITHGAFGRLAMSQQAYIDFAEAEIEEIIRAKESAAAEEGANAPTVKDLEKLRKRMEAKLKELQNKERKDEGVIFEELGVDQLYVDEAHLFKNLQFFTRHTRVKGIGGTASQRATDLFMKIRFLEKLRPGRSTVFATGTPVSNTMAEMYIMQRYLQLDTLKEYGVDNFDGWAGTFGEVMSQMELSPDGRTFRETTAFSKFINIPELVALYSRVADTQTADMLNLPRPKMKGGKIEIVEADMSPAETAAMDAIVKRAENVRGKRSVKGGDNMLNVVTDGRKLATDHRLLNENAEFNPKSKIGLGINSIYEIWKSGKDPALAQLVFLDMGVPRPKQAAKADTAKPEQVSEFLAAADLGEDAFEGDPGESEALRAKFDLYNDVRDRLVAKGIPREQIAFIHEATDDSKKAQMFAKVRAGKIRVIFGTTGKMGVGTNVQAKLIAMHHFDPPWKPAEVEQRDGRILRQGNQNPEVRIIRYVTRRSMDAFLWQTLERKAHFIAQLQAGARGVRHAEDIDSPLPEAAEMKAAASGDSRIAEHADLSKRVRDLETAYNSHQRTVAQSKRAAEEMRGRIKHLVQVVAEIGQDVPKIKSTKGDKFALTLKIRGAPSGVIKDRTEAGEAIRTFLNEQAHHVWSDRGETMQIGELSGIALNVSIYRTSTGVEYAIDLKGDYTYASRSRNLIDPEMDPGGLVRRFENGVADIPSIYESEKANLERARTTLAGLERQSDDKGFARLDELKASKARLAELNKELRGDKEKPKPQEQELSAGRAGEENNTAEALDIVKRIAGEIAVEFKNAIVVRDPTATENWGKTGVDEPAGSFTRFTDAEGRTTRALIELSLNPQFDMQNTAFHEAWHAIQRAIGRPNARILKAELPRLRKIASEDFQMDASDWGDNEVLAVAFAAYAQGRVKGIHVGLRRYFAAAKEFLRRLGNALRGRGWKTSEDVFGKAFEGEFAGAPEERVFEGSQLSQELHPAWHGSPHRFDKFSLEHIGKGEGAQAYGYGLYFAGKRAVAEYYRDKLSSRSGPRWDIAKSWLDDAKGDTEKAVALFEAFANGARLTKGEIADTIKAIRDVTARGALYRVEIPEEDTYLDWDKPLSEQSEKVKTALATLGFTEKGARPDQFDKGNPFSSAMADIDPSLAFAERHGKEAYHTLSAKLGNQEPQATSFGVPVPWNASDRGDKLASEALHAAGISGIRYLDQFSRTGGEATHNYVVFSHDDIKIEEQLSRGKKRRPDPNAVWGMPGETERTARFVRALTSERFRRRFGLEAAGKATDTEYRRQTQDREIYWKKARAAQLLTPGPHLEDYDIYQAQTVYRSKAGKKLQDFYEKRMDPLLAFLRSQKITSFDRYLEARTQVERNPHLMQINPTLAPVLQQQIDDANIFLGFIQGGAKAGAYAHAGRMFDDLRRETLDRLLSSGLIDQATHTAWGAQQHYAPLRGFEEDPEAAAEFARTGRGFDIHGKEARQALGRKSKADSPLAYMFQQGAQAIIRADKNAVDQRVYGAILRYPNKEIWETDPAGFVRVFDKASGQVVVKKLNPQATQRADEEHVFGVKFNGKQFFFAIYHEGLRGGLRTPGGSNVIVRILDALGRWRRASITGLSPEFWENNFERDLQEGLINVSAIKAPWLRTRIVKDLPGSVAALAGKGPLTQWREEFEADGGRIIGYGVDTIQHYKDKIDDAMRRGAGRNVRHGLREVLHLIEVVNGYFENAVRLSTYKNLRQSGMSREKSAATAKELTVNFDRRGEMGQAINAYKFFYNPRIQGTVRLLQALKSKRVRRIVYGMLLAGLLNEWMNWWSADDDPADKMNKWDKKPYTQKIGRMHFGWIPLPGGGTLALPSAYGPGFFFMLGQDLGAYMRHLAGMGKGADVPETIAHIYGNLMNAMSPFDFTTGHSIPSFFAHLIWPSSVPGVDVVTNERWNGGNVVPPDYPAKTPYSQQTSSADDPALVWTAQELNWLTGGDAFERGAVDLAPGWLQSGIDYATGGLGHFVQKVKNFSGEIASGEWPNARDIPFNNVYFPNDERANQQVYYDLRARVDIVKARLAHAKTPEARAAAKAADPVEASVVPAFMTSEHAINAMRKARAATTDQAKIDKINADIAHAQAKARLAWEMARRRVASQP